MVEFLEFVIHEALDSQAVSKDLQSLRRFNSLINLSFRM